MTATLFVPALLMTVLSLLITLAISVVNHVIAQRDSSDTLVDAIDKLLPQTQCAQCGFPGCRPYAEAVVEGASITLCKPGGPETVERLSEIFGTERVPELLPPAVNQAAKIRENECIGCARCLDACPVDAIVGSEQFLHTVIAEHCTGCELCLPPCPVDCIDLVRCPN